MLPRKLIDHWRSAAKKMGPGLERSTLIRCAAALEKSIDEQMHLIDTMMKADRNNPSATRETTERIPIIKEMMKPDEIEISKEEIARRIDLLDDTVNCGGIPFCPPKMH